jgi:NTE family protein
MDPDQFEVAKAVRISAAVPFAFKPVVLHKQEGHNRTPFYLIDGGILDGYPTWLLGNGTLPTAGFSLHSSEKKVFSLMTPLEALKGLVASVHDIGVPAAGDNHLTYNGRIDTGNIDYLDFKLSEEQKMQLFDSGRSTVAQLM